MNNDERMKIIVDARERRAVIMKEKGAEYADAHKDVNSNFKLGGSLLQFALGNAGYKVPLSTCTYLVWFVYTFKHMTSILTYAGRLTDGAEAIEGRIDDLANYAEIFYTLLHEPTHIREAQDAIEEDRKGYSHGNA